MTLIQKASVIVNEHSGGIKFVELVAKIGEWVHTDKPRLSKKVIEDLPQHLEAEILKSKELKILYYTYKALNREKMFVYTP